MVDLPAKRIMIKCFELKCDYYWQNKNGINIIK